MRAISRMASSSNTNLTSSVASRAVYCLMSAFLGSVRMRKNSSSPSACRFTRMGKRPCSSGTRSEGLHTWKAPLAMNRMWSVFTGPYLVVTVVPSTMGSRSRCTPSRDTSGAPEPAPPREAILSISSRKMMPDCSVRRMAFSVTLSWSTSRSASSRLRYSSASGTFIRRGCFFLGKNFEKASCRELCISSMLEAENISTVGAPPWADTANSTVRSSSSPRRSISRNRSRVV